MRSIASMRLKGLIALLLTVVSAPSAQADSPSELDSLLGLSLDELLQVKVITASRGELSLQQAPAVISVITAADIKQWGYLTVAEALQQVPGFYDVYDGVGHNIGTRGINSGSRLYSRGLKVMIDNQAMALRSDGGNMTGLALIPINAVERIEVVRGPASALYGADAFLGVINIITRKPQNSAELSLFARQQSRADPGAGVSAVYGYQQAQYGLLLAGSSADLDRSGADLPASSPRYRSLQARGSSRNDNHQPQSLFASAALRQPNGETRLMAYRQYIEAGAEFLDLDPLNHRNRIAMQQQGLRLQQDWQPGRTHWQAFVHHNQGGVDDHERLLIGSNQIERDLGSSLWELGLSGAANWSKQSLNWGADYSDDDEALLQVYGVNPVTGQRRLLGIPMGHQHFINSGVYLQYRWQVNPYWAYTLNGRYDDHNLYGDSRNYRLGVTGQLSPQLAWKLLYGTSYKAPSAAQLYAQPLTSGDVIGNPGLRPETAWFWESQLSWQTSNRQLLEVSAYRLQVDDKIEVLPVSFNLQPQNRGRQQGWGVEAEWRAYWRQQMLQLQGAWQDTDNISQHPFFGEIRTSTASYPRLQCRLAWAANTGDWGNLALSLRYASPRRASSSNTNANLGDSYQLPGYSVWRLHWFKDWRQHRLSLSVDNLFNHAYAEPGYGGIDLPGAPRQLIVGYQWSAL